MKLKRIFIVSNLLVILSFGSCNYLGSEEYLHEVDDLNDIWTSRLNIRQAWSACYGWIPNFTDLSYSWPYSGCGDEGYAGLDGYMPLLLAQGKINADNINGSPINYWASTYRAVRVCCQFLENSHKANDRLLTPGEVESYNTDVRFLRAFYYSILMEMYGPFVIIDKTIDYSSSTYPTTRNTLNECMEFLLSELDAVIEELPENSEIIITERGRPSKGAAMALKARILLWAASPLVNGNKDYSAFVNNDNVPFFDQTYDENKWRKAAEAYKAVIDLNQYELFTMSANGTGYKTVALGNFPGSDVPWPNGPAGIDPYRSFKGLFAGGLNYWNSEIIWQVNVSNQKRNLTCLGWPRGHRSSDGTITTRISAIQKIVDAFFMNNGKTIDEENGKLYVDHANATVSDGKYIRANIDSLASPIRSKLTGAGVPNRCLNREARFYATIGYQGRGYPQDNKIYYFVDYRAETADGFIQTDRPSVRTGYPVVKYINDEDVNVAGNFEKQCPVFRLAEVYLGYAEALNEYDPNNPDIVKYLNRVRFRAGLPGYSLDNKEVNRERIKRERQIELAFENGKRYFDMRRWKDAEKVNRDNWNNSLGLGGMIYGCNFMTTDVSFYDRTIVDGYIFKKRDYFLPISYQDVANHWGTLIQNPGW